jgi:hypothetical protein
MRSSLLCILPAFFNNSGHEISFINILAVIANRKKLKIKFILPKNNNLKIKYENKKELFASYKTNFIIKFFYIVGNYFILTKRFSRLKKNDLVYIDGYNFYFIISLILHLLINRKLNNLVIWIRYPFNNILKKYIFKFFIYLFNKDANNKLIPIAENHKLARVLNKRFLIKVLDLPSHHDIERKYLKNRKFNNSKINILCPGSFRPEKYGINLVNFLENNIENKNNFVLSIDKKFSNFYQNIYKLNIRFIKNNLKKFEYINEINNCDIVILPYDSLDYKLRNSGIFFEAISMRKIIFVTSDTVMAEELKKNNLEELIVKNWSNKTVQDFLNIKNNKLIKKKLIRMSSYYARINTKKNFINKFLKIIEK